MTEGLEELGEPDVYGNALQPYRNTGRFIRLAASVSLLVFTIAGSGCNNAAEGGLAGAGLGAGSGAIIGSMFGHAGTGAAIGAVAVQKVVLQIAEDQRSRVGIHRAGSTIRLPSVSIRPA